MIEQPTRAFALWAPLFRHTTRTRSRFRPCTVRLSGAPSGIALSHPAPATGRFRASMGHPAGVSSYPRCRTSDARLSPEPDDGMQMPADGFESNRAALSARLATILLSALASGRRRSILKKVGDFQGTYRGLISPKRRENNNQKQKTGRNAGTGRF